MSLFPEVDDELNHIKSEHDKLLHHIICNSEEWRPSNATEGYFFEDNFCEDCSKNDYEKELWCPILGELLVGHTKHIRIYKNEVICLKDSNFNIIDF